MKIDPPIASEAPSEMEDGRSLYSSRLDRWLLDALSVGGGSRVLELAAGTGEFALRVAERVRPGGRVLCTDRRTDAVAESRGKALAAGATDVDARVIDMTAIALPDASVDAVLCRWGLMFAEPISRALAEIRRVVRPGGWLAAATWGAPERNPWTTLADEAMRQLGLTPPDRHAPGQMLSLANAKQFEAALVAAGLDGVLVDEIPVEWTYADAQAYWRVDVRWSGGPIDRYLSSLGAFEVANLHSRVESMLERFRAEGGEFRLPGLALCARARRPT